MQNIGQTAATVVWTTNLPTYDYIAYGRKRNNMPLTYSNTSTAKTQHSATLTGLRPGTTYYYRIKTPNSSGYTNTLSTTYSFRTAP